MSEAEAIRQRSERHPALFWSRRVNRRIGALIVLFVLRTPITPNQLSLAGLGTHLVGAALVLASPPPAHWPTIVAVFLIWQLGLSLDNADGQLARARGTSSPFGAWFDQVLDFASHTAVTGSLVVFAARGLELAAVDTAVIATFALAGNLVGVFASAQRTALMGSRPAIDPSSSPVFGVLIRGRHLIDYGAYLAVWSIGLAWPAFLLAALIAGAVLVVASVVVQVIINWPRTRRDETTGRSP